MYSTDKELLKILVDYSDDLATLKMREGRLPAQAAIHRILALQNNAVVAAYKKVDRFEVIDDTGRAYVKGSIYGSPVSVELSLQDDDRTLKVFVTKKGHNSGKDD